MAKSTFFDKDEGWNKLVTSFEAAPGETAGFVGFLKSSGDYVPKAKRGKVAKNDPITIAQIAAIHEFGSSDGRVPERSFMRSAVENNKDAIIKLLGKLNKKIIHGEMTTAKAIGIVCEYVVGLMKKRITDGVPPPNKPATVNRKKSNLPLVDTSQMIDSIDWEIKTGGTGGGSKKKGGSK